MAKIPGPAAYERPAAGNLRDPGVRVPAGAAGGLGAGLEDAAGAVGAFANDLSARRQRSEDALYVAKADAEAGVLAADIYTRMQTEKVAPEAWAAEFGKRYDEATVTLDEKIRAGDGPRPSEEARTALATRLASQRGAFVAKAVVQGHNLRVGELGRQADATQADLALRVFNDPASVGDAVAQARANLDNLGGLLPADKLEERRLTDPKGIVEAAVNGLLRQNDIAGARALVDGGRFDNELGADGKLAMSKALVAAERTDRAEKRALAAEARSRMSDLSTRMVNGFMPEAGDLAQARRAIEAAGDDPELRAEWRRLQVVQQETASIKGMGPDELEEYISTTVAPSLADGVSSVEFARLQTVKRREAELRGDASAAGTVVNKLIEHVGDRVREGLPVPDETVAALGEAAAASRDPILQEKVTTLLAQGRDRQLMRDMTPVEMQGVVGAMQENFARSAAPVYLAEPNPPGLVQAGNIDIANRPQVRNADGSISTVRSITVEMDGKHIVLPTVSEDGRILSDDEAVEAYRKGGRHLGVFKTVKAADRYAEALHVQQERAMATPAEGVVTATEHTRLNAARAFQQKMEEGLKNDPLAWAQRVGTAKIEPIDTSSPEAMKTSLATRAATATSVADRYGVEPAFFTETELPAITRTLSEAPPAQRLDFARTLAQSAGDMALPALGQLAKGNARMAYTGGMAAYGDIPGLYATALAVEQGADILKEDPKRAPSGTEAQAAFVGHVERLLDRMPAGTAKAVREAADALYVTMASDPGKFDPSTYQDAVDRVLGMVDGKGGVAKVNGAATILPPGVSDDEMTDIWPLLGPSDVLTMGNGLPRDRQGRPIPEAALSDARFEPIGNGAYNVILNGGYVATSGNRLWEVRITDTAVSRVLGSRDPVRAPVNLPAVAPR